MEVLAELRRLIALYEGDPNLIPSTSRKVFNTDKKRFERNKPAGYKFDWDCPVPFVYDDESNFMKSALQKSYVDAKKEYTFFHCMIYTAIFGVLTLEDYLRTARGWCYTDIIHCMTDYAIGGDEDQHEHVHFIMAVKKEHAGGMVRRINRLKWRRSQAPWPHGTFLQKPITTYAQFLNTRRYIYTYRDTRYMIHPQLFDTPGHHPNDLAWNIGAGMDMSHIEFKPERFNWDTFKADHVDHPCKYCKQLICHIGAHKSDYHYYTGQKYRIFRRNLTFIEADGSCSQYFPKIVDNNGHPLFYKKSLSRRGTFSLNKWEETYFTGQKVTFWNGNTEDPEEHSDEDCFIEIPKRYVQTKIKF